MTQKGKIIYKCLIMYLLSAIMIKIIILGKYKNHTNEAYRLTEWKLRSQKKMDWNFTGILIRLTFSLVH
jgi:hypothetical protein